MRDSDKTNIIAIVIAVILAISVILIADHAIVIVGTANRIWNIEMFVLVSTTIGCIRISPLVSCKAVAMGCR